MTEAKSHFRRALQFNTNYCASTVTKYVSDVTGLSAVVVNRKGPKVQGYFALATEIFDDSGAPHTLEHLVFLGSKNYPYKGLLDKLANRAFASTNAWTATDHTAYTLDAAGWEGFAQILPVYLEHVLLPTLTDSGCYTEVHHINGQGEDAGVVYSEMQGRQNDSSSIMELHANRQLYPEGIGFRYETGGMMEALRVLTPTTIRDFHKSMYTPRNLCVVVTGEVDHEDLLRVLNEFDERIVKELPVNLPFKRPWIDSVQPPPLKKAIVQKVEFPEKDESMGEISISFFGPHCSDAVSIAALSGLETFLAGSSVSILEKALVEIKEPYASQVSMYKEERPNTLISFHLSSVPTQKLEEAQRKFFETLRDTISKPLDFEYLKECLRRTKRQTKYYADSSADSLATPIIIDFIFGKRDGSTLRQIETLKAYDMLEEWSEMDWRNFIRMWVVDPPHVTILGKPSSRLARRIKEEDKARVTERVKLLGKAGLQKLENKLKEAIAKNDVEIPKEALDKFKVPDLDSIHFIDTQSARAGLAINEGIFDNDAQKFVCRDQSAESIPLYIHFEHVPSTFVNVYVIISTSSVPVELRPLFSIYLENFFNTPIIKNGVRIEYEGVVTGLEKDTVKFEIRSGSNFKAGENIVVTFTIEPEKYQITVDWLKALFWDSIFDTERLAVTVSKLLQEIPEEKRDGDDMANAVTKMLVYARESLFRARDTLVKAVYLKRIACLLKTDANSVISRMEELRSSLCKIENMRILVIANVETLKDPVTSWISFAKKSPLPRAVAPIDHIRHRLSDLGLKPGNIAHVVPIHAIDSSFSIHTSKGVDILHPYFPALELALAYLQTIEGPLWTGIRGKGLAYGVHFYSSLDSGHITYGIYRAPDAYKAYAASKEVIQAYINGTTPFDPVLLEGAISSIVVSFADAEKNMASAGVKSFVNQVIHGQEKGYNMQLLKEVKKVTVEDLKNVLQEFILPVFQPENSVVAITASPAKVEEIKKGFLGAGFKGIQITPLNKFQDDYGLHVAGIDDNDGGPEEDGEETATESENETEEDEEDDEKSDGE